MPRKSHLVWLSSWGGLLGLSQVGPSEGLLLPVSKLLGATLDELSPSSKLFSGYLEAVVPDVQPDGPPRHLEAFTFFCQHPDPDAPLFVWMSGGPGASSLDGLFVETGPFLLNGQSLPKPPKRQGWQAFTNPYGWNTLGSIVGWEQPAGVGFSRCHGSKNCEIWDDSTSAEANLAVLKSFFEQFPSERSRQVFIAGESYAGVYVPLLAQQIQHHNKQSEAGAEIALKGIAVGNGCVGFGIPGSCGSDSILTVLEYLQRGAPGLEQALLKNAIDGCGSELTTAPQHTKDFSPKCLALLRAVWSELGAFNVYNLNSPCGPSEQGNWGEGEAFACGTSEAMRRYINLLEVQRDLHVIEPSATETKAWQQWDGTLPGYNISLPDVVSVYQELLEMGIRTIIFNGLRDTCVPTPGAEGWTARIGGAARPRRAWVSGGQKTGHVIEYTTKPLVFATVDGAGHLVPSDRPVAALAIAKALASDSSLPAPAQQKCTPVWMGRGYANLCDDSSSLMARGEGEKVGEMLFLQA